MRHVLRSPSKADRAAGLPTSKADALKQGLNRFTHEDGDERVIRRYGSRLYPNGKIERTSSRKANRGGGSDGSRKINENLATPDGADRKAFGKAMADANAKGMDGDHIQEISRTAEGIRFKEANGRGTRAQYHKNMADAGVSVGNQSTNVQQLPPDVNQRIKPAELRAMDAGIKRANGSYRGIRFDRGVVTFIPAQGWVEELAASRTIDTDPLGGNGLHVKGV